MLNVLDDTDESNNGFSGEIWGSCLWFVLHIISFNYPKKPTNKDIIHYYTFFKMIQYILPCGMCRKHLKENYRKKFSINVFKNRKSLSKYVYKLHNIVNKQLNKTYIPSFDDVSNFYENLRSKCIKNKQTNEKLECINPNYEGIKSKSIIRIIPRNTQCKTLEINPICILKKINI